MKCQENNLQLFEHDEKTSREDILKVYGNDSYSRLNVSFL